MPIILSFIFLYTPSQAEQSIAPCDTYQVNGGDQAFLMNLNTPLKWGNTIYNGNIYTSPKGTITFGQGDYTFWDYPQTPSISIAAYDYHAFANGVMWGANNDLYVRYGSNSTSICVDWKVMLWGQSTGEPVYIRMIAYVDPVTYEWTPTYQVSSNAPINARYGARYVQGGPVTPLEIQFIDEPPAPQPTEIPTSSPTPEPTPEPTLEPTPEPTEEPTPEPTEEPTSEPTVEPEPSTEPSMEPVPSPSQPVIPAPILTPDPEREEIPQEIEQQEEMQQQEEQLIMPSEEPTPIVEEKIIEDPIISEEELLEEGEILLENGVIIDENIAIALTLLDNPAELFSALFSDPQQILTALSNIGADMSPEVREEAQDVVVVAVIVTQILGSMTITSTITQMNARSEIRRIT